MEGLFTFRYLTSTFRSECIPNLSCGTGVHYLVTNVDVDYRLSVLKWLKERSPFLTTVIGEMVTI